MESRGRNCNFSFREGCLTNENGEFNWTRKCPPREGQRRFDELGWGLMDSAGGDGLYGIIFGCGVLRGGGVLRKRKDKKVKRPIVKYKVTIQTSRQGQD